MLSVGAKPFHDEPDHPLADAASLVPPVDEEAPQERLGVMGGDLGEHHETHALAVGDDASHPRHHGCAIDHLGEQRVAERQRHGRDEALLRVVGGESAPEVRVFWRDLDQLHGGRWHCRPREPRGSVVAQHRVAQVVVPLAAHEVALPGERLEREPDGLEHPHRCHVPRVETRLDAMHRSSGEHVVDDGGDCLACITVSLELSTQRVADLRDRTGVVESAGDIADELALQL